MAFRPFVQIQKQPIDHFHLAHILQTHANGKAFEKIEVDIQFGHVLDAVFKDTVRGVGRAVFVRVIVFSRQALVRRGIDKVAVAAHGQRIRIVEHRLQVDEIGQFGLEGQRGLRARNRGLARVEIAEAVLFQSIGVSVPRAEEKFDVVVVNLMEAGHVQKALDSTDAEHLPDADFHVQAAFRFQVGVGIEAEHAHLRDDEFFAYRRGAVTLADGAAEERMRFLELVVEAELEHRRIFHPFVHHAEFPAAAEFDAQALVKEFLAQ